jgi:hypothetical protein
MNWKRGLEINAPTNYKRQETSKIASVRETPSTKTPQKTYSSARTATPAASRSSSKPKVIEIRSDELDFWCD